MPDFWESVGYLATALSLSGNIGVVRKKSWGFVLWSIANILWVCFALKFNVKSQVLMFSVYLALSVWGWRQWSKEKREEGS